MSVFKEFIDKGFKDCLYPSSDMTFYKDVDGWRYTVDVNSKLGISFYKFKLVDGKSISECIKQYAEHEGPRVWVAPLDIVELAVKLFKELLEVKK